MPLRALTSTLCLLPLLAASATAMPAAPETATTFARLTNLLPCQPDITALATNLGYHEISQTRMDTDYADIEYSDAADQSRLTVAIEDTPIGAQFSVLLDIPETDQAYADEISAALRGSLLLAAPTPVQNLKAGSAQFWNTTLPGGEALIFVRHSDMATQLIALLSPLRPGPQSPC